MSLWSDLADAHYGGVCSKDIHISWIAPEGDVQYYVYLLGTTHRLTPHQLRDLAILANAALASMPQAASAPTETPSSLPRSGDD